jgi:hypothetical protein
MTATIRRITSSSRPVARRVCGTGTRRQMPTPSAGVVAGCRSEVRWLRGHRDVHRGAPLHRRRARSFTSARYRVTRKAPGVEPTVRGHLRAGAAARQSVRMLRLDHLPGVLPDRADRQHRRRRAAPRSSWAPSSSPSPPSQRRSSEAGSPTTPAGGGSSSAPRRSSTARPCSPSPAPPTSTVSSSAWRSVASGSACTWQSTSRSSPTCCPMTTPSPGPRRAQHRRRAPLHMDAGRR